MYVYVYCLCIQADWLFINPLGHSQLTLSLPSHSNSANATVAH